ncbi:hypothetical protein [Nonomuraea sp. NPDC049158]|uniref:hypothetical protein n=1 Tax=Nonomuraea sp. NPDC049158 TaxID=3155649 RepID=UPI0033D4EE9D
MTQPRPTIQPTVHGHVVGRSMLPTGKCQISLAIFAGPVGTYRQCSEPAKPQRDLLATLGLLASSASPH